MKRLICKIQCKYKLVPRKPSEQMITAIMVELSPNVVFKHSHEDWELEAMRISGKSHDKYLTKKEVKQLEIKARRIHRIILSDDI